MSNYIKFNRSTPKDSALVGDQNTVFFTSDTHEIVVQGNTYGSDFDNLEIGGRNLLRDSAVFTYTAEASNNYAYKKLIPTVGLQPNTNYIFSVEKGEMTAGSDTAFTICIYSSDIKNSRHKLIIPISSTRQFVSFTTTSTVTDTDVVLIYAGQHGTTAGKAIKLTNIKLERGNKATDWTPAPEDLINYTNTTIDNLEIGIRNLWAKKYMMDWNNTYAGIATKGIDDYGNFTQIHERNLYQKITNSNNSADILQNKISFERNKQYVLQVKWRNLQLKANGVIQNGLYLRFNYSDNTHSSWIICNSKCITPTTLTLVSKKGKTVSGISCSYGTSPNTRIYEIQLVQAATQPNAWLVAPEDVDAAIEKVEQDAADAKAIANAKLPLSGGTVTGNINMSSCNILFDDGQTASICPIQGGIQINSEAGSSIEISQSILCNGDLRSTNSITAQAFYETSDVRKKEIKSDLSLDKCYDLIDKCQTVIYSLKDQTKEQIGMIAQEIEEFFPEVIATDEEGFKSLAYDRLVVICFKVLKDIIKRLEKLENEL